MLVSAAPQSISSEPPILGGDEGTRTPDLLRAREALSHLSYIPNPIVNRKKPTKWL